MKEISPEARSARICSSHRGVVKRNFMRLPVQINASRLAQEYGTIPDSQWGVSYWDVHCSIDMLLLRGGSRGNADDFDATEIQNNPILERLPYFASLIGPDGPFGGAEYAFIFKTKPHGITRVHTDDKEAWQRAIRIHIPIVTNPGALLLAEGHAKHFAAGEAWTFDNQTLHSVVNGDQTRVHLIIDVVPNPRLTALMRAAMIDPGEPDPHNWEKTRTHLQLKPVPLKVAEGEPLSLQEKQVHGLPTDGFSTRITDIGIVGRILRISLRRGDIIVAVNGISSSTQSRSALDHMRTAHVPGQTVSLTVLRDGVQIEQRIHLWPDYWYYIHRLVANAIRHSNSSKQGYS